MHAEERFHMPGSADFGFVSGGVARERLRLCGFRGHEALSRLFAWELLVECDGGALSADELDALFHTPCAVAAGKAQEDIVRGVVTRVRALDRGREGPIRYLVSMAPTVSLLAMGQDSRVYQGQTVPEMVASVLARYRLSPERDYRIVVRGEAPRREYAVQYAESDWGFIERWLEHEGCTYWFEHTGMTDLLVIADSNEDAAPLVPAEIAFRDRNDLATEGHATVFDWQEDIRRVPARVVLQDYNYRTPHVRLGARAPVDERGFGSVIAYGEHFKTREEGARIARLRAERHLCEKRVFRARSDCPALHPGHVFELTGHADVQVELGRASAPFAPNRQVELGATGRASAPFAPNRQVELGATGRASAPFAPNPTLDGKYLITSVIHTAGEVPSPEALDDGAPAGPGAISMAAAPRFSPYERYQARFEAIRADTPFRPARRTPWPSIHGLMNGHVSTEGDGLYAEMDELGRYKVKLTFDTSGTKGGAVSRWIRMAQPYAGANEGTHQPLRKGAEVLVGFIDGDPDRPVIVGAVPNQHTVSPTTRANATQSVLRTPSGIRIEMEDRSLREAPAKDLHPAHGKEARRG